MNKKHTTVLLVLVVLVATAAAYQLNAPASQASSTYCAKHPGHGKRCPPTTTTVPPTTTTMAKSPPFVVVCGIGLCLDGQSFVVKGATAYGQYGNPASEIALAKSAGINTIELVEFDKDYHTLSDTESADTWDRVDAFVAAAQAASEHVILNLSEYGQSLQAAGDNAVTTDWGPYLSFVAHRVNTVSGETYATDPTIAMVELWGEIPAPDGDGGGCSCTTAQMQSFFTNTLAEWHALSPVLVSSGGFSYLNDSGSGIPWQAVMSDPDDATCDMEINSTPDLDTTTPAVTSYCGGLGKPWFLSAWSSCLGSSQFSGDLDHFPTDAAMATHATQMYSVARGGQPASYPAMGTDFWNLQADSSEASGSCDIGPQVPDTWAAVQEAAA
jgi:hypothetical protein